MLDDSFNVKITDFGFAKILADNDKLFGEFSVQQIPFQFFLLFLLPFLPFFPTIWASAHFAKNEIDESNAIFLLFQIYVGRPATWHLRRWNVACGKNRPDIRKKLICKAMNRSSFVYNTLTVFLFVSWACGVIMFTLLVGCPPFWHRKQMVMLRNIMEGKYSFTSPEWADISGKSRLNRPVKHNYDQVFAVIMRLSLEFALMTIFSIHWQRTPKISLENV